MKNKKNIYLFYYYLISIFYIEMLIKVVTVGNIKLTDVAISLVMSMTYAAVLYMISTLFKSKKVNFGFAKGISIIYTIIYISQLVYFKIFKTFYSVYSMGNGLSAFQFYKDIIIALSKNIIIILFMCLPIILLFQFGKKIIDFSPLNSKKRCGVLTLFILCYLVDMSFIYGMGRDQGSPYELYFRSPSPNESVRTLGVMTAMRVDFQHLVFGTGGDDLKIDDNIVDSLASLDKDSDNKEPQGDKNEAGNNEKPNKEEEQKPKEYANNVMDIDFAKLAENESDSTLKSMHKYFAAVPPTKQNDYTGKYKGYNLIMITAEGFAPYAINKEVTPTLYKLVNEGYKFTNFYNPLWWVSTSDGEYVECMSLIPKSGVWSMSRSGSNYVPFTMGNQLRNVGYTTKAYHNHTYSYYKRNISHPNMGYDYKGLGNGLEVKKTWPESDIEMMEKTVPEYVNSQPFHTYYMTVSGHMNYTFMGNAMAAKNKELVKDLPYSSESRAYIACQIELDRALEILLNQLEEAGIADKTLISLNADHYPYGLDKKCIDELTGHEVEKNFELYKSTYILYTKGMKSETIDKPCSTLDILPTLSNLMGVEYDSRLMMGRDIFSDSTPLVMLSNRSFITEKGKYNSVTKKFEPAEGQTVDDEYVKNIKRIVDGKFIYSTKILEQNYYGKVVKK